MSVSFIFFLLVSISNFLPYKFGNLIASSEKLPFKPGGVITKIFLLGSSIKYSLIYFYLQDLYLDFLKIYATY